MTEGMAIRAASRTYDISITTLQHVVGDREVGKQERLHFFIARNWLSTRILAMHTHIGCATDNLELCDYVQSYMTRAYRTVPQFRVDKPGRA